MGFTGLTHLPGSNKWTRPEEQGWMLIQKTLNPPFQGLKSEGISLVQEYQIYGTNYQPMSKVQPLYKYVQIPIWWLSMHKNCWCYLNPALHMSGSRVLCLAEILIEVPTGLLRITTEVRRSKKRWWSFNNNGNQKYCNKFCCNNLLLGEW